MDSNEQTIAQILTEITTENLKEHEEPTLEEIQDVARRFLDRYNRSCNKWKIYQGEMTRRKIPLKTKIQKTYAYMKQSEGFTRQILKSVNQFERELNALFHRTVFLAYVEETGDFRFYDEVQVGQMYRKIATKAEGRGNISGSQVLKFQEAQIEDKLKDALRRSIENKREVYKEALERYEESGSMHYKVERTFWWRTSKWPYIHWTDKQIPTAGWIAEGYAEAVMNEDPLIDQSDIEFSLQRLWKDYINLNSKPAAIQQDLVFGRVEFAVKSGDFSTPRIAQYVKLAQGIMYLKNEILNLDYFKAISEKLVYKRNISERTIQSAEKKVIKEFEKKLKEKQLSFQLTI